MTINRDQLAVEILLKSDCHFDPKKVYEIVDQMINQSNKTSFARMVVGPVVKQTNLQSPQSQSPQKSLQPKVSLMANVLKDDEKTVARFEFFDGKGFPIPLDKVKLDGVPVWATVDPARITVAPAPDGLSAIITAVGGPEPPEFPGTTVTGTADGDLGEGVRPITITGDFKIIGGDVATANMHVDPPTPQ